MLKPLEAAVRDHDHIYATVSSGDDTFHHAADVLQILGTGVNSSGSIAPVSAPVASAQRDAMRRAFSQTDRKPQDVDFLELHATGRIALKSIQRSSSPYIFPGTASGDPTEANWVGAEFKRDDELLMGSVKGNVGCAYPLLLYRICRSSNSQPPRNYSLPRISLQGLRHLRNRADSAER